jgi:transcriptional regulator with XRE-family HTH domain
MVLSRVSPDFARLGAQMAPLAPESLAAIAERLRLIRLAYGRILGRQKELEQTEFATMCGISKQMWNTAERGRARLGLDHAKAVFRRTGADLQYIYFGITSALPLALALEIERLQRRPSAVKSQ